MKKIVFLVSAFVVLMTPTTQATEELYDVLDVSGVISAMPSESDIYFEEDISLDNGLFSVFSKLFENIRRFLSQGVRCVAVICAVSFFVSAVEALSPGENSALKSSLSLVSAIAVTVTASGNITSVIGMGKEFISGIGTFSKALLPSVAAAEAACGAPGAATVKATATLIFSDVLINIITSWLLPLVYINIFASTANAASRNSVLEKLSEFSTKIVSTSLKILLGAFVSYIGVAGLVSTAADKTGLRAAQFAIGTAVPIVGGVVSEAAETVVAGAAMIKNSIGLFGMLSIFSAFMTPFAAMLVNYLSFKAASLISSPLIGDSVSALSSKIAESFGLIIAMCASVATVIVIAVIAAMQSVGVV